MERVYPPMRRDDDQTIVLASDELSVPAQDGCRRHDAAQVAQYPTSQQLSPSSQSPTLRVCETKPPLADLCTFVSPPAQGRLALPGSTG